MAMLPIPTGKNVGRTDDFILQTEEINRSQTSNLFDVDQHGASAETNVAKHRDLQTFWDVR